MIRSCSLVFAALVQVLVVQAQEPATFPQFQERIPRHCLAPPPGINLHTCCPIPSLYPDEVMESCGIEKVKQDSPNAPPKPRGPPKVPCKEGICLMQHADLLLANQSVDYEKLRGFIDHWAESNPDFSEAILAAKEICAKDGGPAGPPVCEQDKIFFCLTSNILWNCKLRDLDGNSGCSILKAHMDECRPHFLKRKELEEQNGQ